MSHFPVLVIGDDVESQLAPFDENLDVEPYESGDVYNDRPNFIDEEGERHRRRDDGKWVRLTTRNPNSKWDWYQVGGRWHGGLRVKQGTGHLDRGEASWGFKFGDGQQQLDQIHASGTAANQCQLGDLDIEGARADARKEAAEEFDAWQAWVEQHGGDVKPWSHFRAQAETGGLSIDDARSAYYRQQPIASMRDEDVPDTIKQWMWGDCPVDAMGTDRDVYIEKRARQALVFFAVLKDGQWHEKGEMGWFGMAANEADDEDWASRYWSLLEGLPPTIMLTLVDCHI